MVGVGDAESSSPASETPIAPSSPLLSLIALLLPLLLFLFLLLWLLPSLNVVLLSLAVLARFLKFPILQQQSRAEQIRIIVMFRVERLTGYSLVINQTNTAVGKYDNLIAITSKYVGFKQLQCQGNPRLGTLCGGRGLLFSHMFTLEYSHV